MKVEREVIVDLLPAYFSGEASQATQALVEEYFRDHPDFEKAARSDNQPLEHLKAEPALVKLENEKLILERTRQAIQTRTSFFWVAVIFSALLPLFRLHDHRIVWLLWDESPTVGVIFAALAAFFWFGYLRLRRRTEPMPAYKVYTWLAGFYSVMLVLFRLQNHKFVWIAWSSSPVPGIVFAGIAVAFWVAAVVARKAEKDQ